MSLSLYALTCGHIEGEFGRLMEGGEGNITVPIPVFLIEHPKGRALFDTGLHPDCQHDAAGRLGEANDPICSRSAFAQARKSARGSTRLIATRRVSTSSSTHISISTMSAAMPSFRTRRC